MSGSGNVAEIVSPQPITSDNPFCLAGADLSHTQFADSLTVSSIAKTWACIGHLVECFRKNYRCTIGDTFGSFELK